MQENDMNREWIVTNKNGSYSSSTVSFANTRTYHGILVKNVSEHFDRMVLLSKIFEIVYINNSEIQLDTNYYPGVIYPEGYKYISDYRIFPVPEIHFVVNSFHIKKSIVMDPEMDNVFIHYELNNESPEKILLVPLVSFRSYHSTIKKGMRSFNIKKGDFLSIESEGNELSISAPGKFQENQDWYYNFQYPVEIERGLNHDEDLFTPGYFLIESPPEKFTVEISSGQITGKSFVEVKNRYTGMLGKGTGRFKNLQSASNLLIVKDNILAGYYWFGAWGRDTFISLPGLLLTRGRFDEAFNILMKYAGKMKDGIIPREFSSYDNYITADTSLWFIYAVYKYYEYTKNRDNLRKLYPYVAEIIEAYIRGNDKFDIVNNFIRTKDAPLTWMDANFGGRSITPRVGFPVEINALWYNALSTVVFFDTELNMKTEPGIVEIKTHLEEDFEGKFVSDGKILDVSDPDDYSIRPNFIFAFSLPFPVMSGFRNFKEIVDKHLLTPFGLRTLSPEDPKFIPKYSGGWYSRDLAYHNGTVWPWLAGPYITASVKSGENPNKLLRFFHNLYRLTYLPEIFDGLDPSEPRGCIIQAWSYGELMRAYHEDLLPGLKK